jgi:catechol 2,3-dioxygenase-like lactoylglutathione lyase family enzyme
MTHNRVQLALNVADLDTAVEFYSNLFDVEPHKLRPGYANFAIADPPLKLVLFEAPDATQDLNHLGVELASTGEVAAAARRFEDAGLAVRTSDRELCCHAVQDKVYVQAPDVPLGQWEFYTVLDDAPAAGAASSSGCCATGGDDPACCAAPAGREPALSRP